MVLAVLAVILIIVRNLFNSHRNVRLTLRAFVLENHQDQSLLAATIACRRRHRQEARLEVPSLFVPRTRSREFARSFQNTTDFLTRILFLDI